MSYPLHIALLTISDTRTRENDTSGDTLEALVTSAGHNIVARELIADDMYQLRALISAWIADPNIHCVITTGGTGFSARDSTPEALIPLFDKQIYGFGEVFRALSLTTIGTSTVQSRAFAGIANTTGIFCLPGSTNACKTGWNAILKEQLDSDHKPCNFIELFTGKKSES